MAGVNEDLEDRKIAEAMRKALEPLFPGKKLTLWYISREDNLFAYDEHRIVQGGWFQYFFGGKDKIILRYFGRLSTICEVFDEKVQKKIVTEGFITPELLQKST